MRLLPALLALSACAQEPSGDESGLAVDAEPGLPALLRQTTGDCDETFDVGSAVALVQAEVCVDDGCDLVSPIRVEPGGSVWYVGCDAGSVVLTWAAPG